MPTEPAEFYVVVCGAAFEITIERPATDHDFLDETLLAVVDEQKEPVSLSRLIKAVPLPARLVREAIGGLLHSGDLLLHVPTGSVRRARSGHHRSPRLERFVLTVFQDPVSGRLVPDQRIFAFQSEEHAATDFPLRAADPPAVPAMSEAELLSLVQRFQRSIRRSDRVVGRTPLGVRRLRLRATRLPDGRIAVLDEFPWVLRVGWERVTGAAPAPSTLPAPWARAVDSWYTEVAALARGVDRGSDEEAARQEMLAALADRLRLRWSPDGRGELSTAIAKADKVVAGTRGRRTIGDLLQLLAGKERPLVVAPSGAVSDRHRAGFAERKWPEPNEGLQANHVFDGLLLDGRSLVVGGHAGSPGTVSVEWGEPPISWQIWVEGLLLEEFSWPTVQRRDLGQEVVATREEAVHLARSSAAERNAQIGAFLDRLSGLKLQLDAERISTGALYDWHQITALASGFSGSQAIVVERNSALATAMPRNQVRHNPAAPCDLVLLGDVVVLGWSPGPGESTKLPFVAAHEADVAQALRDHLYWPGEEIGG